MKPFFLSKALGGIERIAGRAPLLLFLSFALVFSLVKSKSFLPYGRFWAEEGLFFYPGICSQNFPSGLFYTFNNHLELFANIGIYLSTLAPFSYAPLITTFFSIAIWLSVFLFIFSNRENLGIKTWHVYLIFLASVGIPQSSEVWANTINLHFVFLLLNAVVLILPAPKGRLALHSAILVFFCGLSGIPANFIAPLFVLAAMLEKSWGRTLQSAAIVITCLIQMLILYSSGYSNDRGLSLEMDIIVLASFTQSFWGLFLGVPGGQMAASSFNEFYGENLIGIILGACLLVASALLFYQAFLSKNNFALKDKNGLRNVKLILSVAVCLVASTTLSLGDKQGLISSAVGGRYFWAPSILLLIMFFSHHSQNIILRGAFIVLLLFFAIKGSKKNFDGPDWASQFESTSSVIDADSSFEIWPYDWSIQLPQNCIIK